MSKAKKINWILETRNLETLKPHPENPRIISDENIKILVESMDKIGDAQPLNITQDGVILSGHARFKVLQRRGAETAQVLVPDRKLTVKEQREVIIRMNKNIVGQWDFDKLDKDFDRDELKEMGFDDDDFPPEEKEGGENKEVEGGDIRANGKINLEYTGDDIIEVMEMLNQARNPKESNESVVMRALQSLVDCG